VEWEPPNWDGTGGYIKWFTDGKFVSGVFGDSLDIMETEIPSEPMYMIMNTAVASSWGFPTPCPDGCECECFECGNPECACALPAGYCENFPASFEIDYVRVYQAVNESRHMLGCSPAHRPTEKFIQGHVKRYVSEGQTAPLEPIRAGGGMCSLHSDCGRNDRQGTCSTSGTCSCVKGWTGPHCLNHAAYYNADNSAKKPEFSSKLSDVLFFGTLASFSDFLLSLFFLKVSTMVVPPSLIVVVVLLVVAFMSSLVGTARARAREAKQNKMKHALKSDGGGSGASPPNAASAAPYQQPAQDHYALPAKRKEVTYCVIDGRLVDS